MTSEEERKRKEATDAYSVYEEIIKDNIEYDYLIQDRYLDRIERRESYILFLRRTNEPDVSYYTLEVEPGGTIRQNGCGPTCLTVVYIFKTGRTDMTPADMCALSEAGNYAPTGATEWSFMTSGAWQLGLNGTQLYNDRDSMAQALRSGAPVIAAVRPGTFTNVGHYIVLYGIDDADQIGVYDPNSQSRSARRWGVVEVLNEIEAMWAYY